MFRACQLCGQAFFVCVAFSSYVCLIFLPPSYIPVRFCTAFVVKIDVGPARLPPEANKFFFTQGSDYLLQSELLRYSLRASAVAQRRFVTYLDEIAPSTPSISFESAVQSCCNK